MEKRANKLINEKSPYLLQHCYNPVEWYPWGDEAFKRAKELNRPIFLSVGYSTCHWCHVMEHESFEDAQIGKLMNDGFVSIKVDREERPDVDKLYMSFVQATTGGGGWPMSVFLTPDLEPIVGGTYFPPKDSYGRPGFASILTTIAEKWKSRQSEVAAQGRQLKDAICGAMKQKPVDGSQRLTAADATMKKLYDKFTAKFDARNGGFGGAPKFPKPVDLDLLLGYHFAMRKTEGENAKKAVEMVERTLEKMAAGGIHDHVGKGFHRYSVDATWHVPHFEKMLYDQGQLLATYANFCKLQPGSFEGVVADIGDYVRENLTSPKGGFYCAEDADSLPTAEAAKKKEGAFCVWTKGEIHEVLGDRPLRHNENITLDELACAVFLDPHGELKGQNVLKMADQERLEALADEYHMSMGQLTECIGDVERFLAERRALRPRPHLDNKILTAWNALAIEGLATAANALRLTDPTRADGYQFMAQRAVEFVREHLSVGDEHEELLRAAYVDANEEVIKMRAPIHAFADDYAFLISALLALYEANFDQALLEWAAELQRIMDLLFWDSDSNSGYYLARADDPSIFVRQQEDQDGAEPSTNSVAVHNLLRLHAILGREEYRQNAENIFRGSADRLEQFPMALPKMVTALNAHQNSFPEIVVVGNGRAADSAEAGMLAIIQSKFIAFKSLVFVDASCEDSWLVGRNERYKSLVDAYKKDKKAAVYVCLRGGTCQAPIHTLGGLRSALEQC